MSEIASNGGTASTTVLVCPRCGEQGLKPGDATCPGCSSEIHAWQAPGRNHRGRKPAQLPTPALAGEDDARCRFLPDLKAEVVCDSCGALMSEQAAARWGAKVFCLPCVHRLRESGGGGELVAGAKIYDNLALLLVTLLAPLSLLTAPVAIYLLIRYRRAPRGMVPRSAFRWWLALGLSLLSLLVWLGLLGLGVSMMVGALTA